jgi:hypothetical protein
MRGIICAKIVIDNLKKGLFYALDTWFQKAKNKLCAVVGNNGKPFISTPSFLSFAFPWRPSKTRKQR